MHVEAQDEIVKQLESTDRPLYFGELKANIDMCSQDVRSGLKELVHSDSGVYVADVEHKSKRYDIR